MFMRPIPQTHGLLSQLIKEIGMEMIQDQVARQVHSHASVVSVEDVTYETWPDHPAGVTRLSARVYFTGEVPTYFGELVGACPTTGAEVEATLVGVTDLEMQPEMGHNGGWMARFVFLCHAVGETLAEDSDVAKRRELYPRVVELLKAMGHHKTQYVEIPETEIGTEEPGIRTEASGLTVGWAVGRAATLMGGEHTYSRNYLPTRRRPFRDMTTAYY